MVDTSTYSANIDSKLQEALANAWNENAKLHVGVLYINGISYLGEPSIESMFNKISALEGAENISQLFLDRGDLYGVYVTLPAQKIEELRRDTNVSSMILLPPDAIAPVIEG